MCVGGGGGEGGKVVGGEEIVKYGGMNGDRSSDKKPQTTLQ